MKINVQHSGVDTGRFFKKDYAELDSQLVQWHQKLADGYDLCVMLARKGPRLNEWVESKLDSRPIQHVVTEIALPFIDMDRVKRCAIADEAIYHGTTFEKIWQVVQDSVHPDTQIEALPLVVTDEAADRMSSLLSEGQLRIADNCINFFIDTIIARFQSLGKPYDMEHPLLYVDLEPDFDDLKMIALAEEIEEHFNKTLPDRLQLKHYVTDCYVREEGISQKSVSLLIDGLFATAFVQGSKPDFAKVRLMRKGNRLCVAVMTPYVINDLDLRKDTGLFAGDLLKVWNRIVEVADRYEASSEECCYQKQKSLVVMANYLLSYASYQLIAPVLKESIQQYGHSRLALCERDLAYLLGWQLAREVKPKLENGSVRYIIPQVMVLPVTIQDRQMPLAYDDDYLRTSAAMDLGLYNKTNQKLSNLFSIMHRVVEIKSRQYQTNYARLRFGESFQSICRRYTIGNNAEQVWLDVNRGIDTRIDRGSVVPNYVHVTAPSYNYWLRLFRSGENEDLLLDQVARIVGFMVRTYILKTGARSVPVGDIELVISLLSLQPQSLERIFANRIRFDVSEGLIHAVLDPTQDGQPNVPVIRMAVRNNMVRLSAIGELIFNSRAYAEKGGLTLTDAMENQIKQTVVQAIAIVKELGFSSGSRELINLLQYDQVHTGELVEAFCRRVVTELKSDREPIRYDLLAKQFLELFKMYPDRSLQELPELLSRYSCEKAAGIVASCLQNPEVERGFQQIVSSYYVLNVWHRMDVGADFQNITSSNKPLFLREFSAEEQTQLTEIEQLEKAEARQALASLLESKCLY